MKKFISHWAPFLIYAGFLYFLSSFSISVPDKTDKVMHFFGYALLGFFAARGVLLTWNFSRNQAALWGGLLATLWGVSDEIHQAFVPGRNSSWGDGLADMAGAFLGAFCFVYLGVALVRVVKLYPQSKSGGCAGCPDSDKPCP